MCSCSSAFPGARDLSEASFIGMSPLLLCALYTDTQIGILGQQENLADLIRRWASLSVIDTARGVGQCVRAWQSPH